MALKQYGNFSYDDSVWSDPAQTQLWNTIGRTEGNMQATGGSGNFFEKTGKSLENAIGTTGAALYESGFNLLPAVWAGLTGGDYTSHHSKQVNEEQEKRRQDARSNIDNVYRQFGFNGKEDYDNRLYAAEDAGNTEEANRLLNLPGLKEALTGTANTNAANVNAGADAYVDYRNNNYASQKINQDPGKFAGSAINTLNTMADVGLMAAGIPAGAVFNGLQGAAGGVADELEQNGLQNFDWGRAKQNAIVGGTTGLVTGALNKGLSKAVNPKTGNLFQGNNKLTASLNKLGSSTALGRLGSTIATGATRGAISGAVGGATGAGLSSALNGVEVGQGFQNALQGAVQGAKSGAITGGTMAGVNKVANATLNRLAPNTAAAIRENQQRNASYGEGLRNQFKGAWESGDSNFKQWLQGKPSKIIAGAANIGNSIKDYSDKGLGPRKAEQEAYKELMAGYNEEGLEGVIKNAEAAGLPGETNFQKAKRLVEGGGFGIYYQDAFDDLKSIYGDDFNPDLYLNKDGSWKYRNDEPYVWTVYKNKLAMALSHEMDARQDPTTVGGWIKRAGERFIEDANQRGVGLGIKDVSGGESAQDIANNLASIKQSIQDGNVSYGELAYLQSHQDAVLADGDIDLAQWAGIDEDTYQNYQTPKQTNQATTNMGQNMSGQELADELTQYSGLPNNVTWDEVKRLASTDADLTNVINNLRQDYIDVDGVAPTANDITGELWDEIRARYALERNYQGPTQSPEQSIAQPTRTASNAWDRVAQEAGYNNYDEVVQAFHQANPNAKINAGAVLTWLDNNPNTMPSTPTTASNSLDEVFEPEARNQIVNKNKAQALGQQLQNVSKQQKYRALYDSLDAKTAQRAVETNAPETLADMGIKPENYLEAAKTSNYINQVMTDLANESDVKVSIPDLVNQLEAAADDVTFAGTDAPNKFARTIRQVVADGSTPDEYSVGYLLKASRDFGDKAASIKGNSDDSKSLRTAYTNVKYILRDAANGAMADADVTGPTTNQKIAEGLAKMGANQKIIDYYTAANDDGSAPTAKDYIRRSSLFEQARDMGTQVKAEQLTRSASKQPTNWATRLYRATGLDQPLELILNNTVAPAAGVATKIAGKALETAGNIGAKIAGNNTPAQTTGTTTNTNPSNWLYNAIGREEGASNAEAAQYLAAAAQEAEVVPKAPNAGVATQEDYSSPTSLYNSIYGTQATSSNSYFPTTGNYWTDVLGKAMTLAMDANDASAFGTLYGMYESALAKQNSTTESETKLTDKQRQANAAAVALNDFEQAEHNFAYDVSDIPVVGSIANLGGNDYMSKAEALALQVGYMLSGATMNKEEAKKIGMAYVPQPRDNATVRQNKINQLRGIISEYQRNNAS